MTDRAAGPSPIRPADPCLPDRPRLVRTRASGFCLVRRQAIVQNPKSRPRLRPARFLPFVVEGVLKALQMSADRLLGRVGAEIGEDVMKALREPWRV